MGAFKPLLMYEDKPFIINIINKLKCICSTIGIVTGHNAIQIEELIQKNYPYSNTTKLIINEDFENGMLSSLQAGLKQMSDCDWILYHFADQPHLPQKFYTEFINEIENEYNWIQPEYNQKKGHPVLLNKSIFPKILDSQYSSLKEISRLSKIKRKTWKCNFPQVVEDIDTKDDYQKLT